MSTLNSRLQIAILNRKKGKNLAEKGFTLIELLITVVILGTLSAIALPNFLGVKDSATTKGAVASVVALAKECSASIVSGLTAPSQGTPSGVSITGTCGSAAGISYATASVPTKVGDPCGSTLQTTAGNDICTVTVANNGLVTATW